MRVGTKSVLFGAHAFWFHPWAVALAWWELYRWSPALEGGSTPAILDPRAWLAFAIHDLGYVGMRDMDGPEEGERHPEWAAAVMSLLCDRGWRYAALYWLRGDRQHTPRALIGPWGRFALYHSRHYAKTARRQPSRLCAADKLALTYTPWWLYLPGVVLSGEIDEYMLEARVRGAAVGVTAAAPRQWFETMRAYCAKWARAHAGGKVDTWTADRHAGELDCSAEGSEG